MIGVVIDGCPSNLEISAEEINEELKWRRPGNNPFTSPRKEEDVAEIVSGVFEGKTTGAPITILIRNQNALSAPYAPIQNLLRPGHANFTYLEKYKIYDHRGGGRSSGRETAARVAAGAIAKKLLKQRDIQCVAWIDQIGSIRGDISEDIDIQDLKEKVRMSSLFCPNPQATSLMEKELAQIKEEGDSLGGIIACKANIPIGLGDPIYSKLEALLAFAMLSIPASKGFEIGSGFGAALLKGSEHNDPFDLKDGQVYLKTNHAGGTLGGISTGAPLFFRVPFKPPSSIKKLQETVSLDKEKKTFQIPAEQRHDVCIAIRAVSVVEAMTALVLADVLLKSATQQLAQIR
jgi:chorismate synthase